MLTVSGWGLSALWWFMRTPIDSKELLMMVNNNYNYKMYDNSPVKPCTVPVKTSGGSRSNSEEDKEGWWVIILIQTASRGSTEKYTSTFYLELNSWLWQRDTRHKISNKIWSFHLRNWQEGISLSTVSSGALNSLAKVRLGRADREPVTEIFSD